MAMLQFHDATLPLISSSMITGILEMTMFAISRNCYRSCLPEQFSFSMI
jgi:hypothetical protein